MTQTDLWKALEETQLYISKYYATALTDEDKHDQLKAYIEKFVLDNGYMVDGFTDEELVNRLYSEMVEYSILTPYLGAPDIDEINVNAWDDVVLTYSDGRMVKTEEHFHSPGHAVDIVKRLLHHSGMIILSITKREESSSDSIMVLAMLPPIFVKMFESHRRPMMDICCPTIRILL